MRRFWRWFRCWVLGCDPHRIAPHLSQCDRCGYCGFDDDPRFR